jgi:hypothetical protein
MSDANEGEELARAWLQGKSELMDDLADLVEGMAHPLDGTARAFLVTVGNAAKASAKRRPASARVEAQPSPEPPVAQTISLDEMMRRRREREHARRLDELGRSNAAAWGDQAEMVRGMGAGGDWRGR